VVGDDSFVATPGKGALPIIRGDVEATDAIFRASAASVIAAGIYAGIPWDHLEAEAALTIEGDRDLALRFARLFALPPPLA
jgi:hypothetical protein